MNFKGTQEYHGQQEQKAENDVLACNFSKRPIVIVCIVISWLKIVYRSVALIESLDYHLGMVFFHTRERGASRTCKPGHTDVVKEG